MLWYHHITSVKLNLSPHAIWFEIPKKQHKNNPTGANTQEFLLKVFQLLETFMATSRCVYFNFSFPLASFPPVTILGIARNSYSIAGICAKEGQNWTESTVLQTALQTRWKENYSFLSKRQKGVQITQSKL